MKSTIEDFLNMTGTEVLIKPVGLRINNNDKNKVGRETYLITIFNFRSVYSFYFYDSISNTEILNTNFTDFVEKMYKKPYEEVTHKEIILAEEELEKKVKAAREISLNDIFSSLYLQDIGTFSQFCFEYGYSGDVIFDFELYTSMQEQYVNLRKLFTDEELNILIELLRYS